MPLVAANSRLIWLASLFKRLDDVVDEYIDWDEEPPYWNNENASVSLLVAAASRAGYVALSDYRRDKRNQHQDVKGRCDLLVGKGNDYLEIEAKQIYIGPKSKANGQLTSGLNNACLAAKQLRLGVHSKRAGLLFAALSLSEEDAEHFDPKPIEKQLNAVKSDLSWYWYDTACNDETYRSEVDGRYYPGFSILIKI